MTPSYLRLSRVELQKKVQGLKARLEKCDICPRHCLINRHKQKSWCRSGLEVKISSYGPHHGEERIISGARGSGTIFFTHCSMRCVYCQNYSISQLGEGYTVSTENLAEIMIKLQLTGCHNINLVTPTHFVAQIMEALVRAVEKGLSVPLVYNSSGYEDVQTLAALENVVDVYMPDAKYGSDETAERYSGIPHYWTSCQAGLKEMHRQVGDIVLDKDQAAGRGLLIRHLILPGNLCRSDQVLQFIRNQLGPDTWVSLLSQYRPEFQAYKFPELDRPLTRQEYETVLATVKKLGLKNALCQGAY